MPDPHPQAELERDPEATKTRLRKEQLHAESVAKAMTKELAEQEENNSFVLKYLKDEKDKWVGQVCARAGGGICLFDIASCQYFVVILYTSCGYGCADAVTHRIVLHTSSLAFSNFHSPPLISSLKKLTVYLRCSLTTPLANKCG